MKAVQHMPGHAFVAMTLDTYADLGYRPLTGESPDDLEGVAMRLDRAASLEVDKRSRS